MEENLMEKMEEEHSLCKINNDNISNLPDNVLLHIMEFLETEETVRTCVLSKRWMNLWKRLTTLSFNSLSCTSIINFNNFVSSVLSNRYDSISLLNLDISFHSSFNDMHFSAPGYTCCPPIDINLLNRVMEYAVSHNCKRLTIEINFGCNGFGLEYCPFIFSCLSLTYLTLCVGPNCRVWKLPRSMQLPALKTLYLEGVHFTACHDSDYAQPFSTCYALNTLTLRNCYLDEGVNLLCLSNSNLSKLSIHQKQEMDSYTIELSLPNLSLLIINDFNCCQQLVSTSNLSFLQQLHIESYSLTGPQFFEVQDIEAAHQIFSTYSLVILSWLRLFADTKKLTISLDTLKFISFVVLHPYSMEIEISCFVRLETVEVKVNFLNLTGEKEARQLTQFLLQNTPLDTVDVQVVQGWYMV